MNKSAFILSALMASIAVNAQITPEESELFGKEKAVKRYSAIVHEPDVNTTYAVKTLPLKKFKAPKTETYQSVIIEETFDKFTGGTEENPDIETNIIDMSGKIISKYTNVPGWGGNMIAMAGQTCCLYYGEYSGGYIMMPVLNLTRSEGNFKITFKAKSLDSKTAWLELGYSKTGNFFNQYEQRAQKITDEWQEYSVDFTEGVSTSYIQIMLSDGDRILLDDIKVIQEGDDLPAPNVMPPSNMSPTGFTANWEGVAGADHYLLNVWHLVIDPDNSIVEKETEDFSNLEIKDGNFVNLDKNTMDEEYCLARGLKTGWSSNIGMYGNYKHYYNIDDNPEMVESAPYSLCWDAGYDNLYTKENNDKTITYFSFNVKSEELIPETDRISILFKYKNGGEQPWDVAYMLYLADYPEIENEFIEIYLEEEYIPEGVSQIFIQFNGDPDGRPAGICAIDNVTVHYGKDIPSKREYVLTDAKTKETSYPLTDLVENDTYYYTVKAVSADGKVSLESNEQKAPLTFTSLQVPSAKPATNIQYASFDANWTGVPYAEGYAVQVSLIHTAPQEQVYTLSHETFDDIPSNALPGDAAKQDQTLLYLSQYCNRAGWSVFYPYFAQGMVGSSYGMNSPTYNLVHNEGNFTVDLKLYGADGDTVQVISNDLTHKNEQQRDSCYMDGTVQDFSLEFSNGGEKHGITIVTSGEYFLVDEITIQQRLKKGDMTAMEFVNGTVIGDYTSATILFYGCEKGDTFGYRVASWGYDRNNKLITSGYSEYVYVDPEIEGPVVGIENIASTDMNEQPYFSGDKLNITLDNSVKVEIFTVHGLLVSSIKGVKGLNTIDVSGNGLFIVKAGNNVYKVIK